MIAPALLLASLLLQDSAQVAYAHDHPDSVRGSIRDLLAAQSIDSAEHLARAYALAWRDSFFVREVGRFAAWPEAARRTRIAADSLRRAGNAALGHAGVNAALRDWRASLRRCESLADSACIGAALGNIGAGFYQAGDLDSARAYFARARAIATRAGDYRTAGNATGALASVAGDQGELKEAAGLYARAAELRVRSGDDRGGAADKNNLGLIAQSLGDLDGARQAFTDALTANRGGSRAEPAAVNLINLGNLASLAGDYTTATDDYREALALYRSTGNNVKAASALHDLGLLNLDRGDYRAALANFASALELYRGTGATAEIVAVRRDIAAAHAAMGNLQGALRALESAERLAQSRGGRVGRDVAVDLALARADLELDFNDYAAAARGYTRAELLARQANDPRARADAQRGQGVLLLAREDYGGARAQFVTALRAEAIAGDKRSAALTLLLLGYTESRRGDTVVARRALTRSLDSLTALGDAPGQAAALAALGDLSIQEGFPVVAESVYRQGLARLSAPAATLAWQLHAGLADALRRQGALAGAADEYRAALQHIARAAGTLRQEDRRAGFAADKWDVYAQFARLELERGRTDSAFALSEELRARQLLDLLSRGRVTPWQTNPAHSAQVAQEQDYRRQITLLLRRLEGPSTGLRGPLASDSATAAVREALARVQQAYGDLLRQVQSDQPEYAGLVAATTAPARDVRAALPRDAALLEYLVSDSASLVFVATADTVAAIELGAGRHELAKLVEFTRSMLTRPSGANAALWRAPLRRLYRYLIEPVDSSGLLSGKHLLLIAPHAELHYVPFAALLGPEQYLVERYELTTVPSASVWLRLRSRPDPAPGGGVLALAPHVAALPGSGAEVAAIQRVYGERARVLTGTGASKRALRDAAPQQQILHLATYGVLNKDNPLFSFVELEPAPGDDGRLEVHEVFGLDLHARLVVLSACQTALSAGTLADVPAGDDWLGLVEAFHFAGAARVLATLWPVEDRATAELMSQFYAALSAGRSEAEALAEAQRATLRKNATAQPFFWAGFTLSGDR